VRAMTDGLVTAVGDCCIQLTSDDAYMDLVSSNGLIPGLDGRISADPITLRKVTSESVDNACVMAWVSNIWVSVCLLRVFRALTASSSLKSMLNWTIAEASDRELTET